jgi:hypothetical protein
MTILQHHALPASSLVRAAAIALGLWLLQVQPANAGQAESASGLPSPAPAAGTPAEAGDIPAFDTAYEASEPCLFCADYWDLLKGDVKHVFTSPARWDSVTRRRVMIKALLVAGTIAVLDGRTNKYVDNHRSDDSVRNADNFGPFGAQYAAYVIGGYLLAGKLAHSGKAKAVAVDGFTTTLIAAGLIVPALKEIAGRSRPRENQGAHDFHPFSGGYSFPSGHSAAAFSVAASVAEHYDQIWVKSLSYGLASLVDYSRMEKDAHFLSDVAAGAMIGVGVAHSIHGFNEGKRGNLAVLPMSDPGGRGLDGFQVALEFGLR